MGIFPANRVRKLKVPETTDRAKYIYLAISLKILWSNFLQGFKSDLPGSFKGTLRKFDNALWGVLTGDDRNLIDLANHLNQKFTPFIDGLANNWENISINDLKNFTDSKAEVSKQKENTTDVFGLELMHLTLGYDLKQGAKGFLLVYLFDESRDHQISESCKITFVSDKLGRIPKLGKLIFSDVKRNSIKPSCNLSFKIFIESPINEQKKSTTPVYKLFHWGCLSVPEIVKALNAKPSPNLQLVTFNAGDKTDFSLKRYTKLLNIGRQQFISYKIIWVKQHDEMSGAIFVTNIGEILRNPPLTESKLYLTLHSSWFEKGKKSSDKNIEILLSIVNENDEALSQSIVEGCSKTAFYRSSVQRHCNSPHWNEMVTIVIPDESLRGCYAKFECSHVTSSELSHKSKLNWISYIPLQTLVGNIIPDGTYVLRLLPKNSYVNIDLWENDVLIKESVLQASKNIQRLSISTRLDSNTLTESAAIHKIKSWKTHSKDLKGILSELNDTDFSKCMVHCKEIFASILEIIDSCADGVIIGSAMDALFSFGRFWHTSDEFKERVMEVLDEVTFISGILKFVSWINIVLKNHKTVQFRETIKSFSLLITIISKSFVNIKRTELMSSVETERYKVVVVNLLMEISNIEVDPSVILCSQIIKVFPESLNVLYKDEIISISEYSFHMISMMKGSIILVLKESASTKISFIDFIRFILNSDLVKDKDLQMRYFNDLARSLELLDHFTPSEIVLMADIVATFCNAYNSAIVLQPLYFTKIMSLLGSYLRKIGENKDSLGSIETRLTFLSLISTYFDVVKNSPECLKEEAHLKFIQTVEVIREIVKTIKNAAKDTTHEENIHINQTILCKKIALVSKIIPYANAANNKFLCSDITYITASVLGEPMQKLTVSNAPYHLIHVRIQELHDKIFKSVQDNIHYLCSQKHFDELLMDPVVNIYTSKLSMDKLFEFLDCFLQRFPSRLEDILTSIHNHMSSFRRNFEPLSSIEFVSDLTIIVQKQVELLKNLGNTAVQTTTLDIENVKNLVCLIKFYTEHQCWAPFKDVINVYKALLIENDAFLEAAELTVYCCNLVPSAIMTDKESELFTAASYYTEAGLWSKALEVLMTLQAVYVMQRSKDSYSKLSEISEKCSQLYANLAQKPLIPFHYFLVGLYGNEVPKSFQNKLFIFRGNPLENIMEFCKRIVLKFPGFEQIGSARLPTSEEITKYTKAYQVIKVDPVISKNQQHIEEASMKFKKFSYEYCFVKDKNVKNELLRMNYQRFNFSIESFLPSYIPFCELSSSKCTNMSAIEMAVEQIQKKSNELKLEASKFSSGEGNIKQFQMYLNGTIDAAVNGGAKKLIDTFLDGAYAEQNPELANHCQILEKKLEDQRAIVGECLRIHETVCPPELRMLHEKMVLQHENKDFNEIEFLAQSNDEISVVIPQHRNALIDEIARRGSKLKKSNKIKRVTAAFFDSQLPVTKRRHVESSDPQIEGQEVQGESPTRNSIDFKEFEAIYATLCNELNQDFNLHDLPRYSLGRRETMSRPLSANDKMTILEKVVHQRQTEGSSRYSSRKEIESYENVDIPDIPSKTKALPILISKTDLNTTQDSIVDITIAEKNAITPMKTTHKDYQIKNPSLGVDDETPVKKSDSLKVEMATAAFGDSDTNNAFAKRSHTIERSIDIKPNTLLFSSDSEGGRPQSMSADHALSADPLKLDLKSLASSFSLSTEDIEKKKMGRKSFESKEMKSLSLNQLRKTG